MKTLPHRDIIKLGDEMRIRRNSSVYINFEGRGEGQRDRSKVYAIVLTLVCLALLAIFYFLYKYTTSHVYIKEASEDAKVYEEIYKDTVLDREKFDKADEKFKMKIDDASFIRAQAEYFMPIEPKEKLDKNFAKSYKKVFEDEYLFNGDAKLIPMKLLKALSRNEIRLIKAEILARHGYEFKTKEFADYFKQKSWYKVDEHYNSAFLSTTEAQNIKFILEYERQLDKK